MEISGKQVSKEELEIKEKKKQEELRRELQKVKMRRLVSGHTCTCTCSDYVMTIMVPQRLTHLT